MDDRLLEIEKQLSLLAQAVTHNTQNVDRLLTRHDSTLYGTDGTGGLVMTVDRLRGAEKRRVWHLRAIWTAILGGLGTILTNLFGGFSPK